MKPIYVKMSAFGSYAGEEVVDFKEVNHGIFLITGDTGAGKTTIFDAITYALYDRTSGGKRDGEMMRSQYAKDDIKTYVELKFCYREENYTVIRSPRQERSSKRKNKDGEITKTMDAPSVELIMPDGVPYRGKIKETNQKIVDIIGLDVDQFTQIAMIAQGDFLKLLHAPSKDRKEIFTKIFNTRIYWRIEEELKNRSKQIYGKLEDNRKDILREMESIRCIEDSALKEQWDGTPHFLESDPERLLELMRRIINEAKGKETEILGRVREVRSETSRVVLELQQAEGMNRLLTELEKGRSLQKQLQLRVDEMNSARVKLEFARKALTVKAKEKAFYDKQKEYNACLLRIEELKEWIGQYEPILAKRLQEREEAEQAYKNRGPQLGTRISKINEFLPKFVEYENKCRELEGLSMSLGSAQKGLEELLTELRKSTELQKSLQEELLTLKPVAEELTILLPSVNKLAEQKSDLEKLLIDIRELGGRRNEYLLKELELKAAQEKAEERTKAYERSYRQFIEEQAVILAHELEDGCPCPVCGSTSHPKKAEFTDAKISQQALEAIKQEKEVADEELLRIREALHRGQQSYESKKTLVEHEGRRIISPDFDAETATQEDINTSIQNCIIAHNEETAKKENAIAAKEKIKHNDEVLLRVQGEQKDYAERKENAERKLKEIEINFAALQKEQILLKSDLSYESQAAAQEELSAAKEQLAALESSREDTARKYQVILEEMITAKGKLKSEEDNLARLQLEKDYLWEGFDQELRLQGFAHVEGYHASLLQPDYMEELELVLQEYHRSVIENENSIKHFEEQTQGKEKVDTSILEARKAELAEVGAKLEENNMQVYSIRSGNELILENVITFFALRQRFKEEYTLINRLEATAIGKVGPKRLNFQTYIQRRYFNSILKEANKRLYTMSNGQFILKCREMEELANQGEVGLDLDVYSMVNDQIRDVKTLSGGESFMAALAMALGMADIIQNTAGSIHIDTMFIDEGFGSLSDETRMQAIQVLGTLSEGKRLVGIISHVSELKAMINTKLLVSKTDKGSKVRWDFGD